MSYDEVFDKYFNEELTKFLQEKEAGEKLYKVLDKAKIKLDSVNLSQEEKDQFLMRYKAKMLDHYIWAERLAMRMLKENE